MPSFFATLVGAFDASGVDLARLGLAWARVVPTVVIVPAFGLRALPAPARGVLGLALAAAIFPALPPVPAPAAAPWPLLLLEQALLGLPTAIAAAVPLWAATMAGGVVDSLRSTPEMLSFPTVEGRATPLGVPLSLLACAMFLAMGGPAHVVGALANASPPTHPLHAAANDIVAGITLAVAVGGPLLAAAFVLEVAGALVARAASPAQLQLSLAPVKALALLGLMAVVLERAAEVLAVAVTRGP